MENQVIIPEMKQELSEMKLPKINKNTRFYYKHREEIAATRRERLLQDPEYQAKQAAKEEAKRAKEEAKQKEKEEKEAIRKEKQKEKRSAKEKVTKEEAQRIKDEKRKIKEQLLGIRPV